ncbi:hypothetical protein F4805DRAFT_350840 [Annulohypoxylon moriforme]|nr:hypothetical protein F4805DRAFT_350840 [Annulohypoxylon moriforme]
MSRMDIDTKNLMLTAEQVRQRFGELMSRPKLKRHKSIQYLTNAMTQLEKAVQKTRIPAQNPRDFCFNDLPHDIKRRIFEMVQSSPGWTHLLVEKGRLIGFDGSCQKVYVNGDWYQFPTLRQELSQNVRFKQFKSAFNITPLKRTNSSISRSSSLNSKGRYVSRARMSSGWVFFDGKEVMKEIMNFQNPARNLPCSITEIQSAVFRMEDIFDGIKRTADKDEGADFILAKGSRIEDLVILLREFRKEVPPEKMEVIKSYRVGNFDSEMYKIAELYPDDADYSQSENYMMGHITKAWSRTVVRRRRRQHAWLESPEGRQWLSYPFHDESNTISRWLATDEGHKWLDSKGSEFLASESGWWWLASDLGYPWLESQQGLHWLDTEGMWFLSSPQALLWASSSASSGKGQKAWFGTSIGMTWASKNCPRDVPPELPQRPTGKLPKDSLIDQSFNNIDFRGWSFVKCRYGKTA